MSKALYLCLIVCLLGTQLWADSQAELADRAEQQIRAGNKDAALATLGNAAAVSRATAESEDRIGFLYAVLQKTPDAISHFESSIHLNADYAPAHFHLGVALWNQELRERALSELQAAAKLDPKNLEYQHRLGLAYQRSGDLAGAVDAFANALALQPTNDELRNTYAFLLIDTRQADRGIEESRKVLEHNPKDTGALMNIGYAELKKGDFDQAEKAYRGVVAVDANSAAAHYDLGIALKSKDQLEPAQKEFREAIRLDLSLPQAHYSLGITDWQLGDFAGLTDEMRAAIKVAPDYAEAHYMLGIALKEGGDLDGALAELRESVKLDASTPGPYNTIGQILRMKGDKRGSEEAFATGTRIKRENESELANTLEQGMRGGTMMKPMTMQPQPQAQEPRGQQPQASTNPH